MTALVEKLNWDSDFFGFNIARLNRSRITDADMKRVLQFCKKNKIRCLFYRAPADDGKIVDLAEQYGFHFSNFRVTYMLETDMGYRPAKIGKANFILRQCRKMDLPELSRISKNLYTASRFYFDKHFSRKACDQLYIQWMKNLGSGKKDHGIYVLADKKKIAGYIGYKQTAAGISLTLIGVNRKFQGQGIGKIMLTEFLNEMRKQGFDKFEVVTEGRNIVSQRLYQGAGFRITASAIDYHKWF